MEIFLPFIFIAFGIVIYFAILADIKRRKTLRISNNGLYVWTGLWGREYTSLKDPSRPGGEWDD